jgi:L-methionine (R)-S-oxide reductase
MMFERNPLSANARENYALFLENVSGWLDPKLPAVANLANMSALIAYFFDRINWSGFYLMTDGRLTLGPFQGLPACTEIMVGRGVCGTAAATLTTQVVPDTHAFPGHIACDDRSNSEIVIPIVKAGRLYGVLDLDSPEYGRFGKLEQEILERAVAILIDNLA